MPANMRKLMQEVPRGLEVVTHDDKGTLPVGRKKVSPRLQNQRMESFLAGVVNGDVPLDERSADVIKQYLDAHHARQ